MTQSEPRHPIRVVAERTGLTPATLRAWERRYGAVDPGRSDGAQRLYSDSDIQRLRLISRLSAFGYSLADLCRSSTTSLARMARQSLADDHESDTATILENARASSTVTRMLDDTRALDPVALRATVTQAIFALGPVPALDLVLSPFLQQVGVAWACAEVSVAQEHLASAVVRDVLGWLMQTATSAESAPMFVSGTLPGEQHEFGAMMSAVVAALAGWRVLYLGPSLPALEIARVARDAKAKVVALSLATPQPQRSLHDELTALRAAVGKRTTIVAGGAAATDHRLSLRQASIEVIEHRTALRCALEKIWSVA